MVIRNIKKYHITILSKIIHWQHEYPYRFSTAVSTFIMAIILFYTPSIGVTDDLSLTSEDIQFIDLDTIQSVKRVAKKEISEEASDEENADVERAVGMDSDSNAVDLSFYPNVARPKLPSSFSLPYPKVGRKKGIEAKVMVELTVLPSGRVTNINVLRVSLNKELPEEEKRAIRMAFSRNVVRALQRARYSPAVVNGKIAAVRFLQPLQFRLVY